MNVVNLDRDELAAANINPDTGLATDYLNHFNEVAMLIDMLESMPDMSEEILDWAPLAYPEHFTQTGFRAKDLAIRAYELCDPDIRKRFDDACQAVEIKIGEVQVILQSGVEALGDPTIWSKQLYSLIAAIGGVINPNGLGDYAVGLEEEQSSGDDQSAIDALFD
ncbi:hypothetical protein [Hirschia baltica]|uniref:Uncharacterized protein n=1 Tax=Hirschia baltica (strain ATCC 49814 / DSM 5838 / IFAM 1418) TaxID=582402 RepID=C6XNF4_HIRBI|nr:hypothetical protein [Hirschia baltica]ACT60098.1 conserved hypothetical protein [Hirschia baltica ATCC 49814]